MAAVFAVACGLLAGGALAAPAADLVTSLPGWGAPLTTTYSGYLDIQSPAGPKHLHYLLYTAQGQVTPSTPLTVWFNGGPGCSSMEGAFQESGPLWTAPGGATLQRNDYSFNKFAHTMYLEAPACVGFSKADRLAGCAHNDNSTAADNLAALQAFFVLFPELSPSPLWLNGESYAGLYIPMLAYNIYAYNQGAPAVPINLKGILVGNGCIGSEAGVCGSSLYGDYLTLAQFHGHAFLSDKAFEAANAACGDYSAESPACRVAVAAATAEAGNNFDVYDLYSDMWGTCNYGNRLRKLGRRVAPASALGRLLERQAARLGDNNCTSDDDLTAYLNLPAVQAALHVTPKTWEECGGIVYDSEMKDERTVIYPTLIEKAQIQVVIFNGQADACVPVTDNQWWTRSMGYPEKAGWTAWTASDGSNGGYVTTYKTPGAGSFTFATVRGSGHMVPQMQPMYAYDLAHASIMGAGLGAGKGAAGEL